MATAAEIRAQMDKVTGLYKPGTATRKSKMKTAKDGTKYRDDTKRAAAAVSAKQQKIVAAARKRIAKAKGATAKATAAPAAKKVTRRSQLKSAVWNAKTSKYDIPNVAAKSNKKGSRSTEARLG